MSDEADKWGEEAESSKAALAQYQMILLLERQLAAALSRAEAAEKACAAMRDILSDFQHSRTSADDWPVCPNCGTRRSKGHAPDCRINTALQFTVGRDYVHKSELSKAQIAALEWARNRLVIPTTKGHLEFDEAIIALRAGAILEEKGQP